MLLKKVIDNDSLRLSISYKNKDNRYYGYAYHKVKISNTWSSYYNLDDQYHGKGIQRGQNISDFKGEILNNYYNKFD